MKLTKPIQHFVIIAVLISGTAMFVSCSNDIDIIDRTISDDIPIITVENFTSSYTDSALLQMIMLAPLMEFYGKKEEPYTEFIKGLTVWFYDGHDEPTSHISARIARYYDDKDLWELKDSVVFENINKNKLETELLYWNRTKDQIYTDKFVRITKQDDIIRGYGLESDSRFDKWTIKNGSAELYIDDE